MPAISTCTTLNPSQFEALFRLWNAAYPANIAFETVEDARKYVAGLVNPKHYLLTDAGEIIGWAAVFTRDAETWFAIILSPDYQGRGFGSRLLARLQQDFPVLNGWLIDHSDYKKINGETYASPLSFYLKHHFTVLPEVRLEIPTISAVKIRKQNEENTRPR